MKDDRCRGLTSFIDPGKILIKTQIVLRGNMYLKTNFKLVFANERVTHYQYILSLISMFHLMNMLGVSLFSN